jgi:recombination protein RecT
MTDPKKSALQTLGLAIQTKAASFHQVSTKYLPADRLVKLAQLTISRTPLLAQCSTVSVIESLMVCARLGLEPNEAGGVWLVPFKTKERYVCTPIVDYRGALDVARRNTSIHAVHADIRYEADQWTFAIDTTSPTLLRLTHVPAEGERGNVLGAYFVAKLAHHECQAVYLTLEQIEKSRAASKGADSDYSPWKRDWEAMAKKTAIKRGVNLLPRTPDVQMLREALAQEDQPTSSRLSLVSDGLPEPDVEAPTVEQVFKKEGPA